MVSGSWSTSGPYDVSTGLELAEALGSFPWRRKRRRAVVSADSMAKLGDRIWLLGESSLSRHRSAGLE